MPFTTIDGKQMLLGVGIDVSLLHNLLESERISNELLSYATLETDFEKTLEQIARTRGTALGVTSARPAAIKAIVDWSKSLESRGITLVPVSAARQKS